MIASYRTVVYSVYVAVCTKYTVADMMYIVAAPMIYQLGMQQVQLWIYASKRLSPLPRNVCMRQSLRTGSHSSGFLIHHIKKLYLAELGR